MGKNIRLFESDFRTKPMNAKNPTAISIFHRTPKVVYTFGVLQKASLFSWRVEPLKIRRYKWFKKISTMFILPKNVNYKMKDALLLAKCDVKVHRSLAQGIEGSEHNESRREKESIGCISGYELCIFQKGRFS